jgi:FKBP-type peptidyl-prolyl cis-trans isomerase FklB
MHRIISLMFIMVFITGMSWAAETPVINGFDDEISYSVGHQVGRDMVRQGVKINPELFTRGVQDATGGIEPLMPFERMIDTLAALREKIIQQAKDQKKAARSMGEEFLIANGMKPGVVTLESGLQYKILKPGDGQKPKVSDTVEVNYKSMDIYGKSFDSTFKEGVYKPVQFKVTEVIPGWTEALQLMEEGAKWEIYVPTQLAFNDKTPLAGQTVVFEIELLKIVK